MTKAEAIKKADNYYYGVKNTHKIQFVVVKFAPGNYGVLTSGTALVHGMKCYYVTGLND